MNCVVFFKTGLFCGVNQSVQTLLEREFPDARVRTVDVFRDILAERRLTLLAALAEAVSLHRREILKQFQVRPDLLLRTPTAFRAVKEWVRRNIRPAETQFTFQTQSWFDASHPEIPHFLYTDRTSLGKRQCACPNHRGASDQRWLALESDAYRSARINFTMSNLTRNSLVNDYSLKPERAVCVYSGVEMTGEGERPEKAFGSVVLFSGTDWKERGGPEMLAAFEQLRRSRPEARLHIVGCRPRVRMEGVKVLGALSAPALEQQFREADIFCLPGNCGHSANAFVEAMHYGLPCVGTRVEGAPERILNGKTGLLVEPGDRSSLASALTHLIDNPTLCHSMGLAGQDYKRARFTWDATRELIGSNIRMVINRAAHAEEEPIFG